MNKLSEVILQMIQKNKITTRNAFEIPMPNVLKLDEFRQKDADWKKLSTTLNASAKIYGYRVESYGIDMYKMVGVFTRA